MISKIEGIIISETSYSETSKIINILTKEYGIIGVMCKGAKRLKSPLRAKTLKFTYGYFYMKYKKDKLSILTDVDVINSFNRIKCDIGLISYVSYITELTSQVFKQNNDNSIFLLYRDSLLKIENDMNPLIIMNILELKYLDYLGVGLNLDSCIKCGSTSKIVTINPDEGGYICKDCYLGEKVFDSKSIKLIRMYYLVDISSISNISINDDISNEINYFLDKYYDRYTGLYLKSKEFLKKVTNF